MTTEDFRALIRDAGAPSFVVERAEYIQGELDQPMGYQALASRIKEIAADRPLFYLSLPPTLYRDVVASLRQAKLLSSSSRLLLEKPFGLSLDSARQLQAELIQSVNDDQIYRVDHFLGKSVVRSLPGLVMPFKDNMNGATLRLFESADVAERGALFDMLGVSRDMVQNHTLAIIAQAFAEQPKDSVSRAACIARVAINGARFGQYEGYRSHRGVDENSQTETFISFDALLGESVALHVESGKALHARSHYLNLMHNGDELGSVDLDGDDNAYEILLQECIEGDRTYFIGFEEIEAQWRVTEHLLSYKKEITMYPQGADDPL